MSDCLCTDLVELDSERAENYIRLNLTRVCFINNGWTQLLKCNSCHVYWELEWKDSKGGFDSGITTIHRLDDDEARKKWEHCLELGAS